MAISTPDKAVIEEHLRQSLAEDVSLHDIHGELVDIFSQTGKYTLPQITAVTSWLRSEALQRRRVLGESGIQESAPFTNEDVDFNNPTKNASREWHIGNIARHISHEQRQRMRFSLLPGKNDFDVRALEGIGIQTRKMVTFMLGEDPRATAEYVRMCRRNGILERHIGEMGAILPNITEPIGGVYWDFFGQICPSYIMNTCLLPVEPNSDPIPIGINIMRGREHKGTVAALLKNAASKITNVAGLFKKNITSIIDERLKFIVSPPDPAAYEGVDLVTARNDYLQDTFLRNVGVAHTRNWLLPDEARKIIEIFMRAAGIESAYDELTAPEKYNYFSKGMTLMTAICNTIDEEFREENSVMTTPLAMLSAGTAMGIMNRPFIQAIEEPQEYVSAHKNRPFTSFFGVVQTRRRHYERQIEAMKFLLDVMSHYAPPCIRQIQTQEQNEKGIGIFEIQGIGPKKEVTYKDLSGNTIAHIRHDALMEACVELMSAQMIRGANGTVKKMHSGNIAHKTLEEMSDMADVESLISDHPENVEAKKNLAQKRLRIPGSTIRNQEARITRNQPCPCGSGKKFKKCCMRH